jgi:hypothetical protein
MFHVITAFLSVAALSAAGVLFAASRALKNSGPEPSRFDSTVTRISLSRPPPPAHLAARMPTTRLSVPHSAVRADE